MVIKSEMADKMTKGQRRDFEWFKLMMPDLYQKYGPCFVSISDRKITGVYQTYAQAVNSALEQADYGDFIVQEVGDSADAYTATFTSMWVMP